MIGKIIFSFLMNNDTKTKLSKNKEVLTVWLKKIGDADRS
jgi:hypothetical protein